MSSYNVAVLHLMAPMDFWQNSTPFLGAVAFCTTKITFDLSLVASFCCCRIETKILKLLNEDEFETFKKFDVLHALGAHQAENIKVEEPSLENLKK